MHERTKQGNEAWERSKWQNKARDRTKQGIEQSKGQNEASAEREHQDVLVEGREKEQVVWAKN